LFSLARQEVNLGLKSPNDLLQVLGLLFLGCDGSMSQDAKAADTVPSNATPPTIRPNATKRPSPVTGERVPPVQRLLLSCEHPDATKVSEVVTRLMMLP
jgi:hypothetical protein